MIEWIPTLAAICLGVPISVVWRLQAVPSGMLCAGINILLSHWWGFI